MEKNEIIRSIDKIIEWALYMILFTLPFSKSIVEICISIAISLFIIKKIIARDFRLRSTPANLPLLFFFLTAAISLVNSPPYLALSLRALFAKNLKFIALYLITIETMDDRVKVMNMLKIGLVSAIIIFADALIQYFITHADLLRNYPSFKYRGVEYYYYGKSLDFIGYPTGSFPFPNDLSSWLLMVMPVGFFVFMSGIGSWPERCLMLAFSLTGLYIFVLAKARTAWFSLMAALAPFIFLSRKIVITALVALFFLVSASFFRSPGLIFGFSSTKDRAVMWTNAVKIFKEHPVMGNGINTFFNRYRYVREDRDRGLGSYAHNCYLQMACDTGILGLGSFLWFLWAMMSHAAKSLKDAEDRLLKAATAGLACGIAAFLTHAFFDTNLYSLNLAALFWLAAGFLTAMARINAGER